MRDVFAKVGEWLASETPCAVATLVDVRNAAPAPLGASMAVTTPGAIVGDIGAGCYESEIVEAALGTAADGRTRTLAIDLSSDDLIGGGGGCGGYLEVVTWRPGPEFLPVARVIAAGLERGRHVLRYVRGRQPIEFTLDIPARRRLVVVGGTTLARELATIAARLDFRTVVVDPRPAFATPDRLDAVAEILVGWPDEVLAPLLDEATPLLVVSHDPKLDLPALRIGLESASSFVGLLGSRRAQRARRAALAAEGVSPSAIERIRGPVGLDIGGISMAETAVSILAELIAVERRRHGGALVTLSDPIHDRQDDWWFEKVGTVEA